jgi:hypothetical protein
MAERNPIPWREGEEGGAWEKRAGALFRGFEGPAPLGEETLARVAAKLKAAPLGVTRPIALRRILAGRTAMVTLMVATGVLLGHRWLTALGTAEPVAALVAPSVVPPAPFNKTLVTAPGPEPAPMVSPRAAAPRAETPDPLAEESRLIAAALEALHAQRNPATALRALDGYAARFPMGKLVGEARKVRLDALLASGDREAALAALGPEALSGPRGQELMALRVELLADLGRCTEADAALVAAVASGLGGDLERRARGRLESCVGR